MQRIHYFMIACLLLATLGITEDPRLLEETLKTKDIIYGFVRSFAKEYFKEFDEAYSGYMPNVDLEIKKMNEAIEERLLPCMNGELLTSGYSNTYYLKNTLNSFISFANTNLAYWRLSSQDLNGFANAMINGFNQIFSYSYNICSFNTENRNVEYHGIDYLYAFSNSLTVGDVTRKLLTLYDNSNLLEKFEKAMNNLVNELRRGIDNLDFVALGRELCKAYLIYDPFPALPSPTAALNFFNQTMNEIPLRFPLVTNLPNPFLNDFFIGTKCLMSRSPSNITKFINFLILRYANLKLGTYFNLTNEDYYRVGYHIQLVILGINNFFRESLGCFNYAAQGYSLKGYLLYVFQNVQNYDFFNQFYNSVYSSCNNQGTNNCFIFTADVRHFFQSLENIVNGQNVDFQGLGYLIPQLFNLLFPFSNYHPTYQASQYSSFYEGDLGDYPNTP